MSEQNYEQYFQEITDVDGSAPVRNDIEFLVVQSDGAGSGKELVRQSLNKVATALKEAGLGGLSDDAKNALLELLQHVAYIDDDGQDYYDALEAALTHRTLSSITAVFTQGGATIYTTDSLDSLKQYLVVTAHYSDNTDVTLADSAYTLSGTLTEGTSTITVSYGGKTTTFTVTVTEASPYLYELSESDFLRGYQLGKNNYPYYDQLESAAKRISYVQFDLLLSGGKTYKFEATSTKNTAQMGCQFFNQKFLNDANSQTSASHASDVFDPGWQSLTTTINVAASVNSSPIVGVRLTFRQSTANPVISDDFAITRLTIEEVTA